MLHPVTEAEKQQVFLQTEMVWELKTEFFLQFREEQTAGLSHQRQEVLENEVRGSFLRQMFSKWLWKNISQRTILPLRAHSLTAHFCKASNSSNSESIFNSSWSSTVCTVANSTSSKEDSANTSFVFLIITCALKKLNASNTHCHF